jgi:hypothetical protein
MSNVLQVSLEREFSDEFMQGLFNLCDTGVAYWSALDTEVDDNGTEFYDDEKEIVIGISIYETEKRSMLATEANRTVKKIDGDWRVIHKIDGLVFMKGIERIMSGECECRDDIFTNVCLAVLHSDDSHLDPECVDTIVQAGLYNELVWG